MSIQLLNQWVVQRVYDRNTLLVFAEGENIEELYQKLWSIEIWLGCSVCTGCDVAILEQMMLGERPDGWKENEMFWGKAKVCSYQD